MRGQLKLEWVPAIEQIPREEWDAMAVPLETPLLEWEWLRQFEASGSMVPENGWLPYHLTVRSDNGLIAAAPLYVKGHSEGEFVWDYMWADVAHQLKVDYYPKLIGMSPATPAVGYRFLIAPGEDEDQLTDVLLYGIDQFCEQNNMSGSSFHFADPKWEKKIIERGYTAWLHQSYEWVNQDFSTFDDYLQGFTKNQRRNIKRERANVKEHGLEVRAFSGEEIPEHFFPILFDYYEKTNDQFGPWAAKYLNRRFFEGLYPGFRERLLIMAALENGETAHPVGMSFLLAKGERIIGRYWGAARWIDSLHFEACYYGPIEWAIEHGVKYFDPGAGSSHKLRRGFFSIGNHSLHKFRDPVLRRVMEQHIDEINHMEQRRIAAMNATLPLKTEYMPQ
jgi:predicted N-acyltransferase